MNQPPPEIALRAAAAEHLTAQLARNARLIARVHRTIVDKFAGLTPHGAYSNSNFYQDEEKSRKKVRAEISKTIIGRVEAHRRQEERASSNNAQSA